MRLALALLSIASAAASAKPPKLVPAAEVDAVRLFARPAAEALAPALQPALGALEAACTAGDAGELREGRGSGPEPSELRNSWMPLEARVFSVPGFDEPVAIAEARCVLGKVGFETHTWVRVLSEPPKDLDLGGTLAFDEVKATSRGLVGVTYLDKIRGAPSRCRFTWLKQTSTGALRGGASWETPAAGEGAFATCE